MAAISPTPILGQVMICPGSSPDHDVILWVGKIDQGPNPGEAIVGVAMDSRAAPGQMPVGHAPISSAMFKNCLASDISFSEDSKRSFEEGYRTWRQAFEDGKAGVWAWEPNKVYWTILEVAKQ